MKSWLLVYHFFPSVIQQKQGHFLFILSRSEAFPKIMPGEVIDFVNTARFYL